MNRLLEHLIIYLQWFIVTSIAFPIGMLAGSAILVSFGVPSDSEGLLVGSFMLTGVLVAIAQLLILNRSITRSSLWIVLTAIGIGVGGWIAAHVLGGSSLPLTALMAGALGGLAPGLLQVGLLNSPSWKRGEWLLLTVAGWGLAHFSGSLFILQGNLVDSVLAIGFAQRLALNGWAISGLIGVLLLLFFTPIARRRELSGRIAWLP